MRESRTSSRMPSGTSCIMSAAMVNATIERCAGECVDSVGSPTIPSSQFFILPSEEPWRPSISLSTTLLRRVGFDVHSGWTQSPRSFAISCHSSTQGFQSRPLTFPIEAEWNGITLS